MKREVKLGKKQDYNPTFETGDLVILYGNGPVYQIISDRKQYSLTSFQCGVVQIQGRYSNSIKELMEQFPEAKHVIGTITITQE